MHFYIEYIVDISVSLLIIFADFGDDDVILAIKSKCCNILKEILGRGSIELSMLCFE